MDKSPNPLTLTVKVDHNWPLTTEPEQHYDRAKANADRILIAFAMTSEVAGHDEIVTLSAMLAASVEAFAKAYGNTQTIGFLQDVMAELETGEKLKAQIARTH